MASNPITTVRDKLWEYLESSEDLAAFMGTGAKYKLDTIRRLPPRVTEAECPALALAPATVFNNWSASRFQDISIAYHVVGVAADPEVSAIEEFYWLVYTALMAGHPDFGLEDVAATSARNLRFSETHGTTRRWTFEFDIIVVVRKDPVS
jgi:hypothetical protein